MNRMYRCIIALLLATPFLSLAQVNTYPKDNPVELGKVTWLRDYDEAVLEATITDKPIFLLFQEVPGCANCTKYGAEILSHPLMVEMIETNFVPLAIYNNISGHDREVLVQFKEPTWNNPVIRIVDQEGVDIVSRVGDFRSKALLAESISEALHKRGIEVPHYFKLLHEEWRATEGDDIEEAYLSMYCFWTGEKEIAQIKGVVFTEAGYMHGREVVKIAYDKTQADLAAISDQANKVKCADEVYSDSKVDIERPQKRVSKYRKDKDDKYYLRQSRFAQVPMTQLQKVKVNSAIGQRKDPKQYLSARQISLLDRASKNKAQIDEDIIESWWTIE